MQAFLARAIEGELLRTSRRVSSLKSLSIFVAVSILENNCFICVYARANFMQSLFYIVWYIQIILESLPVSSSGHLALLQQWLECHNGVKSRIILTESVEHVMHIPTVFVIGAYVLEKWGYLLLQLPGSFWTITHVCLLVVAANICTVVVYYFFKLCKPGLHFPVWLGLAITALLLLSLYGVRVGASTLPSGRQAVLIGLTQGLALLPGVSRLASTCVMGIWLGLTPLAAFVFSCTIQLPLVLAGATKGLYDVRRSKDSVLFYPLTYVRISCLCLVSFVSYGVLHIMADLIDHGLLVYWGWYMVGIAFCALIMRYKEC